jgi:hypothetical protein
MSADVAQTAAAVMPYVTATVAAYGMHTLDKVRDSFVERASEATVGRGHRLLDRILRREPSRESVEEAVVDLAAGMPDSEAALRLQIRKALAADPELAADVRSMLPPPAMRIEASGERSIAVGTNSGVLSTGDDNANTIIHR